MQKCLTLLYELRARGEEAPGERPLGILGPTVPLLDAPPVDELVPPHGGRLVDRVVPPAEVEALRARAASLPRVVLGALELADLELIATGAASPLEGFLGREDHESVVARMRLADGTVWPIPLSLAVDDATLPAVLAAREAALVDAAGRLWGTIRVTSSWRRDPGADARAIFGTDDPAHPGVADLLARSPALVGGPVSVLPLPTDLPFAARRLTPRAMRVEFLARGWRRVAGFQTRNPIHRAHEHLTKLALEQADGLVIHPIAGDTRGDDVPAAVRFRTYEALIERHYPKDRTILAAFPAAMRWAGPREALFHALVRRNYGIAHLIVGRDHAGTGRFYEPLAAQRIFDRFEEGELGVTPLRLDPAFHCRACGTVTTARTCAHGGEERLELSGTRVREILRAGGTLPPEFTRPEVAAILREHYGGATVAPPRAAVGCIVWFTGLSAAGKSTLAAALRDRLAATHRVEVLDGDEVRTVLSKGLGFSRADRDANVQRIGYVARLLARNGVVAVAAAISPYAAARAEVRALAAADGVPFVEVHVTAPLDVLVARDPKGLYRRALAGDLPHFTGIDDPYEVPEAAEVVVRTDVDGVEAGVARIVEAIEHGRDAGGRGGPAGRGSEDRR